MLHRYYILYIYIYICMYTSLSLYIYIYIYTYISRLIIESPPSQDVNTHVYQRGCSGNRVSACIWCYIVNAIYIYIYMLWYCYHNV